MSEENKIVQDDEIDLLELSRAIWSRRRFIVKITGIFTVLGLIIAFTSKVEYEASAKLLSESQEGSLPDLGGLGGLAGLAGFDLSSLGGGGQVLSPELFPEIVNSEPFLRKLINEPTYFERLDSTLSSFTYFKEIDRPSLLGYVAEYTIGLPSKIKNMYTSRSNSSDRGLELTRYSKEDWSIMKNFAERISVEVESSTGLITIKVEMPDPIASAQISKLMLDELTNYITKYKVEKAKANLEFVRLEFEKAKSIYQLKQADVARFTNRNRNLTNALAQVEFKRLQNDMDISFEVYKSLASQLEQAKIHVNQETPVFTVLEPVRIPEDKSSPKRGILMIAFIISSLFISTAYILTRSMIFRHV
ncbi:Wzz/FepE/Etk N-terminal domain-containing protein [Ekhidna sp.]|uniref:Wzz/FepE/Etk N-terminal domain-containing protein n=1 Tax=Ekhidna sp. TaxID=2608089 RepID=UPI0035187CE7